MAMRKCEAGILVEAESKKTNWVRTRDSWGQGERRNVAMGEKGWRWTRWFLGLIECSDEGEKG